MRRRGLTLTELVATLGSMVLAVGGTFAVMLGGLRSFQKTDADIAVSQPNAQAMRRVVDTLRFARTVVISNSGKTITYTLPALTANVDPWTGEREIAYPVVSDGVTRSFSVANGKLTSEPGGRILLADVKATDPQQGSSQYSLAYAPFQSTTIGSRRAITVTFITQETVGGVSRFARMKSTVLIQNAR